MKKILAMLLALVLVFSLAACGGKKDGAAGGDTVNENIDDGWSLRTDKVVAGALNAAPTNLVTITTALGDITGVQKEGYKEFRGVRYATAERFEDPVQVTGWTGAYDATKWGDRCWQFLGLYGMADSTVTQFYLDEGIENIEAGYSEDCLNLNIYTPDNAEKCPVLVYIHGGSFLTGSNTDTSTDGEAYAHHGVITVSINYRLGPYQAFYGDGYTGYLAIKDQVTALHWIRDNIADYGGDPSRITIMGESAGAVSVQNLLITPLLEEGVVSGAIMLSGGGDLSSIGSPATTLANESAWETLKMNLGVDSIADLKDISAKELYTAWLKCGGSTKPMINGECLTGNVADAMKNGTIKNVPCIIGILSEDMYPFSLYTAAVDYGTARAKAGGKPVYLYYFDRQIPGENQFGAFHAGDLPYIFGTLYRCWRPFDEIDYSISNDMIDYVANFVRAGDPNGKGLAEWVPVTADSAQFINFGEGERAMVSPDAAQLSQTQQTSPVFPYADSIKTNTKTSSGQTAVTPEALLGDWLITGWVVISTKEKTTVTDESIFSFEEDVRHYYVNGALQNTRTYQWKDEKTITINMDGTDYDCGIYFEGDVLMLEDPRYGIAYTCYRKDGSPAGSDVVNDPDLADPFYEDAIAVTLDEIQGEWAITGWIVMANGSFAPAENASYVFEGNTLKYLTGGSVASASGVYFDDGWNLGLRTEGASQDEEPGLYWTTYKNDKGQLLIEDPRFAIIYVCEKK